MFFSIYIVTQPPSTMSGVPVMYDASSEAWEPEWVWWSDVTNNAPQLGEGGSPTYQEQDGTRHFIRRAHALQYELRRHVVHQLSHRLAFARSVLFCGCSEDGSRADTATLT